MAVHYNDIDINKTNMLLDLPMTEGIGTTLNDVATPSRLVTLVGAPTWTALVSELITLNFNGTTQYGQCLNADCADLGFTTGDYSILCVINWTATPDSQIIMGRYELNVGGWELYLFDDPNYYLTLRHHHAGGVATRSACNSSGWTQGTNWLLGISRVGSSAIMYRNGVALTTTGVLEDPEATTSDLTIGVRYTKNDNYFHNMLYRPRIIGAALTASQHETAYELIKEWL